MRLYVCTLLTGWLLGASQTLLAQPVLVIDKKAIVKSTENLSVNLLKKQRYKKIQDFTEEIRTSYAEIQTLQQQVLEDLKNVSSVQDLSWSDLSKSIYLSTELIRGARQPGLARPGLEIDVLVEHPLFNQHYENVYRNLFIAGGADPLPNDLTELQQAKQNRVALIHSFHQGAAERKAYAAVAFQYLSEDLLLKATELNEVLKQSARYSMTEAERIRLQSYAEDYLLLAARMLERSDQLLLEVASVKPMQQQAQQNRMQLERASHATTPVSNF
uniref:TolC family protein n=1 Tax=Roseihalotalea indica TaxID=2867963 RepID=A0AA49GIT1_9BACT|nr:hypothetical protein K4G66_18800 [Tunicatimonas sp. TK19036]